MQTGRQRCYKRGHQSHQRKKIIKMLCIVLLFFFLFLVAERESEKHLKALSHDGYAPYEFD